MAFIYSFSTPKLRVQGITEDSKAEAPTEKAFLESNKRAFRTFTKADGSASFEGSLVAFDHRLGLVRIRQRNGRTVDLEFSILSKADQTYLKELTKENE